MERGTPRSFRLHTAGTVGNRTGCNRLDRSDTLHGFWANGKDPRPSRVPVTCCVMAQPDAPITPRRLVVLADSLAFHGPQGPLLPRWPDFYPALLRDRLEAATSHPWTVTVVTRAGWGMRDVWLTLQKDLHVVQDVLMGADAVVLGVGSFDWVPVGVPTPLRALLPFVRPPVLRRRLRVWLDNAHPWLIRLTRGALIRTPASVFAHSWRKSIEAFRLFAPDAALCAVLPSVHRADYYAHLHPHHARGMTMTRELGQTHDVALVDLAAITTRHLPDLNPDGIHWGWAQHVEVADAMAQLLLPQLQRQPPAEAGERLGRAAQDLEVQPEQFG